MNHRESREVLVPDALVVLDGLAAALKRLQNAADKADREEETRMSAERYGNIIKVYGTVLYDH